MPLQKLQFRPGVNREGTSLSNEGGWYDCDKIRFRSGYPEKIGGWTALSYNTFLGVCRSLWNWVTLKQYNLLGVGTNLKFYVEDGGDYYDITPIREINGNTASAGPPVVNLSTITLTASGTVLTVSDPAADSLQANDFVTIAGAGTIGGVNVNGEYQIATATSGTTYTVTLATAATGSNSAATITIAYQINTGLPIYTIDTGWGAGPWPQYSTLTLTNPFTATGAGVSVLTVTTPSAHNLTTGDSVYFESIVREINGNTPSAGPPVINASTITLTASGTVLTISDSAADSLQVNDFVTVAGANSIGGVNVNGKYQITTIISGTSYTVALATSATGSVSNSAITLTYQANPCGINGSALEIAFNVTVTGATTFTISTVIGVAPGPVITYTTSSTAASGGAVTMYVPTPLPTTADNVRNWGSGFTTGFGLQLRLWSQTNFGERLLFSPRGGSLYVWDPGNGATPAYNTRGTLVTGTYTPTQINQIMVSDSSRITIAFGANDPSGTYAPTSIDPLLIRWTGLESYTNWEPQDTNQAGDQRLSHGSTIISAIQTRQEIIVFTDAAIYAMQYIGPPLVWQITLLADNISIVSPNAVATAAGGVYWMGVDKFYIYSGRVETLPCSVRQFIFNDINRDQEAQFNAGTNEGYSEVWWNYCSKNSTVIDRYVIFNYLDRVWYYGTLDRTAWLDSPLRQFPMAATAGNIVVFHEAAVDDGSTNPPSPINAYIQSSDFDIGDGHNYGFVWRMIPDITFDGSNTTGATSDKPFVQFTVRPKQNPGSNYGTALSPTVTSAQSYAGQTTYNVQQFTEIVYSRVRGRQMAFKIESNSIGTQWQLGVPRIDVRPDGRN